MVLIAQKQSFDNEERIYETNDFEEIEEYIEKHGTYDLSISTSKGEWNMLSNYAPNEIMVKGKTYRISEYYCDRLFINIEEVG